MVQVLCFTGRGFDTCWRPANVAIKTAVIPATQVLGHGDYTPIRFFTGDFA